MTHFLSSGPRNLRSALRFRTTSLTMLGAGAVLLCTVVGTACSGPVRLESPACATMRSQVKEKRKLDAEVKAVVREARELRKQGDTAAALAVEERLEIMLETQRLLKDALDNSSRDCSPVYKDQEPVLDPALREKQRLEGR